MPKPKSKTPKPKRYTLALSHRELKRLSAYAAAIGIGRPAALAKLMKKALREAASSIKGKEEPAPNQLGLFDSLQMDIFNNSSKVIKQTKQ